MRDCSEVTGEIGVEIKRYLFLDGWSVKTVVVVAGMVHRKKKEDNF